MHMKMLMAHVLMMALAVATTIAAGQSSHPPQRLAHLKQLFPAATSFSPKEGAPPHIKALADGRLVGYAFLTTELEPLERGYDGPIQILVGMDPRGVLVGVVMVHHSEPYGNFSIEPPEFAAQFVGKSIRDRFRVGDDIDAVSRATLTVTSSTRAIKNSSRRVARALLAPPRTSE